MLSRCQEREREIAIELSPEEQVEGKDLIEEFLRLTKMIVNTCEEEW